MVFRAIEKAKARFPDLEVREWDLLAHPELGPRHGVTATPAILINGRLEFSGVPKEHTLLGRLDALASQAGK